MYRYVYIERSVLNRIGREHNLYWMPCLLLRFPECRPKDVFIYDCLLRSYFNNPYLGLLLLRKAPRNIKVVEEPPIETQRIAVEKCSGVDIVSELNEVSSEVFKGDYTRLYELIDRFTDYSDIEVRMRVFLRTRRYVIPAERVREAGKRIAVESVKSALKTLCIRRVEESYRVPTAVAEPIYILFYIDPKYTSAGFIVNKKIVESTSHAKVISKLREDMKDVFK